MKKKIKDLTVEEWTFICEHHYCGDCPISKITVNNGCLVQPIVESELEKEVDVDE